MIAEGDDAGLEPGQRGGLGVLGGEPVLEGLLEPLGLPLDLRVVRLAVLLGDAEAGRTIRSAVSPPIALGDVFDRLDLGSNAASASA